MAAPETLRTHDHPRRQSPPPIQRLHPPRPWPARYAVTAAAWLVALAPTVALAPYLQRANFVFFWIAVLFAAWYGGLLPALLAAVASVLAVNYFFVPPLHHFGLRTAADVLTLAIFIGASMTVATLTAALGRAERRAHKRAGELATLAQQLEEHATDLGRQTEQAQELAQELEQSNELLEETAVEAEESRHAAETERARLQSVLDGLPDVTFGYDAAWRWTYMNPTAREFLRTLGRDPDALMGRCAWDAFPELVDTKFHTETVRAVAECRVAEFEEWFEGLGRWYDNRVIPIAGGALTFSRDVTSRKRAEQGERLLAQAGALLTSSLDYRETLQRVAELAVPTLADWCAVELVNEETGALEQVAVAHADATRVEWARELRRRYPPPPDAATGAPAVVRTGRAELYPLVTDEMLAQGAVDDEHLRLLRQVGFRSLIIAPLTARGRTIGALGTVWAESRRRYEEADAALVTELARRAASAIDNARLYEAEQRARREAERAAERVGRLQAVTAALAGAMTTSEVADVVVAQGVVALGAADGVLYLAGNDGAPLELVRAHGLPEATVREFRRLPLDTPTAITEAIHSREAVFLEDRAAVGARYPFVTAAAAARVASEARAAVPLVAGGRAVGGLAFGFDDPRRFSDEDRAFLTALAQQCALALERARLYDAEHSAHAEAERERAAAEAANRAKSEFLATMSHELRTPLNAIGGYAELLEMGIHGPVTEAQREALARVRRSQRVLLSLINDVLNLARIEAGTVDYAIESVPLDEALDEVEAMVAPQVAAKGLHYYYDDRCAPGVCVRADRDKLRQIVLNLLSNAIKFTDAGGSVRLACDGSDPAVARVRVTDTGRGIPSSHLESIFEPFVQVDAGYTRTAEGTGLGLAISRDLARAMGAELVVERSAVGGGSTFVLTIPRA